MSQPSFAVLRLFSALPLENLHYFVSAVMVSKTADVSDRVFNGVRFNGYVADDVFFGLDATGTQVVLSMDSSLKDHTQTTAFLKSILNRTSQLRVDSEDQALRGCSRLSAEDKSTPTEATMRFDTPWKDAFNFHLITNLTGNVLISGDMTTYNFKLRGVSFRLRVVDGKITVDSDTRCWWQTYLVFSNFCAYLLWESKRLIDGCAPSYAHLVKDLSAPEAGKKAAAVGGGATVEDGGKRYAARAEDGWERAPIADGTFMELGLSTQMVLLVIRRGPSELFLLLLRLMKIRPLMVFLL